MRQLPPIVVDTREKAPFTFIGMSSVRRKLDVGDYSVKGFEDRVTVERKSMSDLFATLGPAASQRRFAAELERGVNKFMTMHVVIEASPEDVADYGSQYTGVNGYRLLDKLFKLCAGAGANVIFGGTRRGAEIATLSALRGYWAAAQEGRI